MQEVIYNKTQEQKSKVKTLIIPIHLFPVRVQITLKKETDKVNKLWNKKTDYDADTTNYLEEGNSVLVKFATDPIQISVAVHEFVHASQMILDYIGHDYKHDTDEPLAYLVSYLTEEFIKLSKKHNIKIQYGRIQTYKKKTNKKRRKSTQRKSK